MCGTDDDDDDENPESYTLSTNRKVFHPDRANQLINYIYVDLIEKGCPNIDLIRYLKVIPIDTLLGPDQHELIINESTANSSKRKYKDIPKKIPEILNSDLFAQYDVYKNQDNSQVKFMGLLTDVFQALVLDIDLVKRLLDQKIISGDYGEEQLKVEEKISELFSYSGTGAENSAKNRFGSGWEKYTVCEFYCILYAGEYKDMEFCPICKTKRNPTMTLYYLSPREWIRRMYMRPEIAKILKRNKTSDSISDVWDADFVKKYLKKKVVQNQGNFYNEETKRHYLEKDNELLFSLHIDGAGFFSFKSEEFNIMALALHNLPIPLRFLTENMLPIFAYPNTSRLGKVGSGRDMSSFLYPIVEDFAKMSFGFQAFDSDIQKEITTYAHLAFVVGEMPHVADACGMTGCWSLWPCRSCLIHRSEDGCVTYKSEKEIQKRDPKWFKENVFDKSSEELNGSNSAEGFYAKSCIFSLGSIHPLWSFPLDTRNLFYETLMKKFLGVLFSLDEDFAHLPDCIEEGEERKMASMVASLIRVGKMRLNAVWMVEHQSNVTTSELKNLHSLFPIFQSRFNKHESLTLFSQISTIFRIVSSHSIPRQLIEPITKGLEDFVKEFENRFTESSDFHAKHLCGIALHSLTHLGEYIINSGPPRCFWAYPPGERVNDFLAENTDGHDFNHNHFFHIINDVLTRFSVVRLCNSPKSGLRIEQAGPVLQQERKSKYDTMPQNHLTLLKSLLYDEMRKKGDVDDYELAQTLCRIKRYYECRFLLAKRDLKLGRWVKVSSASSNSKEKSFYAEVNDFVEVRFNGKPEKRCYAIISPLEKSALIPIISPKEFQVNIDISNSSTASSSSSSSSSSSKGCNTILGYFFLKRIHKRSGKRAIRYWYRRRELLRPVPKTEQIIVPLERLMTPVWAIMGGMVDPAKYGDYITDEEKGYEGDYYDTDDDDDYDDIVGYADDDDDDDYDDDDDDVDNNNDNDNNDEDREVLNNNLNTTEYDNEETENNFNNRRKNKNKRKTPTDNGEFDFYRVDIVDPMCIAKVIKYDKKSGKVLDVNEFLEFLPEAETENFSLYNKDPSIFYSIR